MAIVVRCPDCSKRARLPESEAGQMTVCAACGYQFTLPAPLAQISAAVSSPSALIADGGVSQSAERSGFGGGSWALAAVAAVVIAVSIGALVILFSQNAIRDERRAFAKQLNVQADELSAKHRTAEARAKYQELADYATPFQGSDPQLQKLVEDARAGAAKLAQVPIIIPAAKPVAPANATNPAQVAGHPAVIARESQDATVPRNSVVARATPDAADRERVPKIVQKPIVPSRPPIKKVADSPDQLSDEKVGKAIQKGVDFLIREFDPRAYELREGMVGRGGRVRNGYHDGADVLCVYALMQSGEAINDPRLNIRGEFMVGAIEAMKGLTLDDHFATYSRGLRATALALNNRKEDKKTLRLDVNSLLKTSIKGAYTYYDRATQGLRDNTWDNSNSQYGLLGVWSGAEAEVEVPSSYWQEVEKHWTHCQSANGQWSYVNSDGGGRLTMTCAGIASLFVCHDWLDAPKFGGAVGREPFSPALRKGLGWLEQGDHAIDVRDGMMWGYSLYGVERVGLASGFKFFGKHNWYPELARQVLQEQKEDGSWGNVVDTAYALLFLSRGRHPILMNKLRYEGYWSNRPRDVANLAKEAGKQLERPINWQVVPLATDWTDWTDSPILYLASHLPPKLSDADVEKMRQYILAGGMLFVQADGDSQAMSAFAVDLGRQLFPKYEMTDVPASHPLFSSVYKLTTHPPLKMVSNGARILMLFSPTDISRRWQLREQRGQVGKPIFQLGINMFVYAAGRRDMRNRLDSNLIGPTAGNPSLTVKIARIRYNGNWDPEPYAWARFARWFRKETGYALDVQSISLRDLDAKQTPFAHLTGTASFTPSVDEVAGVKKYVEAGGVLLIDLTSGTGGFNESLHALLVAAFPNATPNSLRPPHPLLRAGAAGMEDLSHTRLRPYTLEKFGHNDGNIDIFKAGKGHVLFTSLDLTSGLLNTGTWGIVGFEPSYAQSLIKNTILWTLDGEKDE